MANKLNQAWIDQEIVDVPLQGWQGHVDQDLDSRKNVLDLQIFFQPLVVYENRENALECLAFLHTWIVGLAAQ